MPAKRRSTGASPGTRKSPRMAVATPEPTDRVSRSSKSSASPSPSQKTKSKVKVDEQLMSPQTSRRGRSTEKVAKISPISPQVSGRVTRQSAVSPVTNKKSNTKKETPKQRGTPRGKSQKEASAEVEDAIADEKLVKAVDKGVEPKTRRSQGAKDVKATPQRGSRRTSASPEKREVKSGSATPSPRKGKKGVRHESPILKEHAYVAEDQEEVVEELLVKEIATTCGDIADNVRGVVSGASPNNVVDTSPPKSHRSRDRVQKVTPPPPVSRSRRSRSAKGGAMDVEDGGEKVRMAEVVVELKDLTEVEKSGLAESVNEKDAAVAGSVDEVGETKVDVGVSKSDEQDDEKVKELEENAELVKGSEDKVVVEDDVGISDEKLNENGELVQASKEEPVKSMGVDMEDERMDEGSNVEELDKVEQRDVEIKVCGKIDDSVDNNVNDEEVGKGVKTDGVAGEYVEQVRDEGIIHEDLTTELNEDSKEGEITMKCQVAEVGVNDTSEPVITLEDSSTSSDDIQITWDNSVKGVIPDSSATAMASRDFESMETDDIITIEPEVPTAGELGAAGVLITQAAVVNDPSEASSGEIATQGSDLPVPGSETPAPGSEMPAPESEMQVPGSDTHCTTVDSSSPRKRKADEVDGDVVMTAKKQKLDSGEAPDNCGDVDSIIDSYVIVNMSDVPPADSPALTCPASITSPAETNHNSFPANVLFSRKFMDNPSIDRSHIDQSRMFSVASYNILCCHKLNLAADTNDEQKEAFRKQYRHARLMDELRYLDSDIVCLQEVDDVCYSEFLQKDMLSLGYAGHYKARLAFTDEPADGCATFYKTSRFTALESEWVSLSESAEKEIDESGLSPEDHDVVLEYLQQPDILLIDRLECKFTGQSVTVGNIHVGWMEMDYPNVQSLQIACAFREVLARSKDGQSAHILAGDFNQTTTHPGYHLAKDGYLSNNMISYLQGSDSIVKSDGTSTCLLNLLWKSFQHSSSHIKSAYLTIQDSEPEYTVTPKDATVDYIFYSSSTIQAVRVMSVADLGSEDHMQHNTPTLDFPSDHLSLMATFAFK